MRITKEQASRLARILREDGTGDLTQYGKEQEIHVRTKDEDGLFTRRTIKPDGGIDREKSRFGLKAQGRPSKVR